MRKIILFALTLGAASAAIAADPAPQGQPHGHWNSAEFQQMRAKMKARRADDVALLIGLRPDQRPALDAFLATMEPKRGEWGEDRKPGSPPPAPPTGDETFLAGLDKMSARMDRRDTEAKQHIEAARKFYTSLSPEQQRRFDALERLRRGGHGGMHHGGGHGPRGGMGGRGPEGAPPPPPQG